MLIDVTRHTFCSSKAPDGRRQWQAERVGPGSRATKDGLEIKAGIEIEWVISAGDGEDFVSAAVGPGYGMTRLIAVSDYVRDVIDALSAEGVEVDQFHPEYAVGPLELSVAAASPVDAADTAVLARSTIRAVGQRYNYRTSFSPKVEAESAMAVTSISVCGGTDRT